MAKKAPPNVIVKVLMVFETAPFVLLRIFILLVLLWGIYLGLWSLGLIGMGGRDTIEPQRTVRLHNQSFQVVKTFLEERIERTVVITTERYIDPFR